MNCSICDSEMDLEGRGGIAGEFGVIPVQFCEWCYSSLMDMFEKMMCEGCEERKEEDE